ncbi:hypothetical protein RJO15_07790 [Herbaspirillum huttiense F1]|uniref:hypothetical protein n=1 Tax=Herbaspirillum huttiense TaxID=863372 RepID=UPI002888877A|nr:hypothetical protein [Herbaspirillum huttiense]MDT0355661.1 hypothetical protein [Herbaspirillum huttiense F1]
MRAEQRKGGALAKLAGIFCQQPYFRAFLDEKWQDDAPYDTPEKAADLVRRVCEVDSRAAFDQDAAAADRFHDRIRIPYVRWQLGRSE